MFDSPDSKRQLVNSRLEQRRNQATIHRIGGSARRAPRRRHRSGLRMTPVAWFTRRRRQAGAPGAVTA